MANSAIPAMFFALIFWGLWSLDGEQSVDKFKVFIISAEAMFGGIFAIVTEALFSAQKVGRQDVGKISDT